MVSGCKAPLDPEVAGPFQEVSPLCFNLQGRRRSQWRRQLAGAISLRDLAMALGLAWSSGRISW